MRRRSVPFVVAALALLLASGGASGQGSSRRLATIAALRQFPGFYHLQNVLMRGELVERGKNIVLHADDRDLRVVLKGATLKDGPVEVRGEMIDVGRLQPGDPRVSGYSVSPPPQANAPEPPDADTSASDRPNERWPRPGEELILNVTAITEAQPATKATVRALSLEPWKFDGQTVTVVGNFHGRNLFGDVGGAPGKSRYDFVLRGSEGAVWVTGLRPRGKGFDLDVDRRADTSNWLQVTGTVARERGLVLIQATDIALAKEPEQEAAPEPETSAPPLPVPPAEVVFSSPTAGETDVVPATTVRIQFSRGLQESSIAGHLRAGYTGSTMPLDFKTTYDAATRSIEMKFPMPLQRFSTIKVDTLDGLKAFDGAPVTPWTLTFSTGS